VADYLHRKSNQALPFEQMEYAIQLLRLVIAKHCNQSPRIVERRGKATIHSLRDTYATRMLSKGLTLHKLAMLLGHTNTAMTSKYAHLEHRDVVDEARKLLGR
jgi:site-specific recombinase XerD